MTPDQLLFAKTHEWIHVEPGGGNKIAIVGISAFAVEALTDLVYIELPKVGAKVKAGESFGEIESVKAVSDLYSPLDGEVVAVNDTLPGKLEQLHDDPYGAAWIAKIKFTGEPDMSGLMNYAAYQKQCEEEGH